MSSRFVSDEELEQAVWSLNRGRLVAFPTESWYGLATDPFNELALNLLYTVKRRPADKPILVLVEGVNQLDQLAEHIPEPYSVLMEKFWPGPLTMVFPANPGLPARLTAGTGTVAIRCSSNPVAVKLVARFGRPVTGTSANISGSQPHRTADGVAGSLENGVDVILDGGITPGRTGSTIVSFKNNALLCIREGQVPFSTVQAAVNQSLIRTILVK